MSIGRCHITRFPGPPTSAPAYEGDHYVDTLNDKHYLSVGTDAVGDWVCIADNETLIETTLGPASSVDFDVTDMANLCTIKYIVCLHSAAQNKWKSFEMLAGKKTSTTVEDTLYSVIGSNLNVSVDFDVDGTDAKLIFTNNEAFSVTIKAQKNILT